MILLFKFKYYAILCLHEFSVSVENTLIKKKLLVYGERNYNPF